MRFEFSWLTYLSLVTRHSVNRSPNRFLRLFLARVQNHPSMYVS